MSAMHQKLKDETAELRKEAGAWLRERREAAGLSQRELAAKVGIDYYTFISQIEAGRGRVPPERYEGYARALNVDAREFATTMLRYNDPHVFAMIFGDRKDEAKTGEIASLESRLRKLEAKLSD